MLVSVNCSAFNLAPSAIVVLNHIFLFFNQFESDVRIDAIADNVFIVDCSHLENEQIQELSYRLNLYFSDVKRPSSDLSVIKDKSLIITTLKDWKYNKFV